MDPAKTLLKSVADDTHLSLSERLLTHALAGIRGGSIRIVFDSGLEKTVGTVTRDTAELRILHPGIPRKLLLGGSMALAESWMDGHWKTDDLSALLRILARNQSEMGRVARGASKLLRAMDHASHRLRANTKDNAKANIQAHYDLSNQLYETFLDPTLTYSAAIFQDPSDHLESAQLRKIDRLIHQLSPVASDHVLEIGSGWGACAIRFAQKTGCRVTSLTLSTEQAHEARRRVAEAGLSDRVEIRLQDYRDVTESFDHVVSVEMIEAVGHEFLPEYFACVDRCLRPGGRFALQAITLPDERYKDYLKSSDFIRKHIFPGGHLPCPGLLHTLTAELKTWQLLSEFEFGRDYAETLRRWRDTFLLSLPKVRSLGFDDIFIRKWLFYLAYCEAGFDTGLIHVRQITYAKA